MDMYIHIKYKFTTYSIFIISFVSPNNLQLTITVTLLF